MKEIVINHFENIASKIISDANDCNINCRFFHDINRQILVGDRIEDTEEATCDLFNPLGGGLRLNQSRDKDYNKVFLRCPACVQFEQVTAQLKKEKYTEEINNNYVTFRGIQIRVIKQILQYDFYSRDTKDMTLVWQVPELNINMFYSKEENRYYLFQVGKTEMYVIDVNNAQKVVMSLGIAPKKTTED